MLITEDLQEENLCQNQLHHPWQDFEGGWATSIHQTLASASISTTPSPNTGNTQPAITQHQYILLIWPWSDWGEAPPVSSTEYLTQYHTPFLTMHGSDKLPWGRGLCIGMCNQCRATSSLSHPINEHSHGWQALANHHSAHWPLWSVTWPVSLGCRCSGFYSSDLDTAVHTGIREAELLGYCPHSSGLMEE